MTQIIVKSMMPLGFYEKTFSIEGGDYEKTGDLAMEAMTRAVEEVVKDCLERSQGNSCHFLHFSPSPAFVKHFFSSFGPLVWAFEKGNESDLDSHYTTLTELVLRNAGYSNLSSLVSKCTSKLDGGEFDPEDLENDDEDIF